MLKAARNVFRSRCSVSSALYWSSESGAAMPKHAIAHVARKRTPGSQRYTSAEYRPYVTAIGQLALAWNDLHEQLGLLFHMVATLPDDSKVINAFQVVDSDRLKRKMVKAVFASLDPNEIRLNPRAAEDVKWICSQADALEEIRNNAIHSPLLMFTYAEQFGLPTGVFPNDLYGNVRAAKLKDKDLLSEYRYVRDAAAILRDFAEAIEDAWRWTARTRPTWPQRPRLPKRGQKSQRRARREDRSKQLPLLPESSPPSGGPGKPH